MSKNLPRKALISISSFNGAIYPGGHKTGLFFNGKNGARIVVDKRSL